MLIVNANKSSKDMTQAATTPPPPPPYSSL